MQASCAVPGPFALALHPLQRRSLLAATTQCHSGGMAHRYLF